MADVGAVLIELQASTASCPEVMDRAADAFDAWIREWVRWQVEFCLSATDEEIAEADRLFGTTA